MQLLRFIRAVVARFQQDGGFRLSASLAYTTLLSIVPVAAVALGVFAAFPAFQSFTEGVQQFLGKALLPPEVAARVLDYIDQAARNAARLTTIGLAFVAATAFLLMGSIEKSFNDIWRSRRNRPLAFRILMYWGVMTLGPLVIGASLATTSYASGRWVGWSARLPWASDFMLWAVPFLLLTGALTLLYIVVPTRVVAPRHAFAGALVAAIVFEIIKRGFATYLAAGPSYATVYGTLAAVPIFLVWIYLSWVVVVLGAEIVALAPDYDHASPRLAERAVPGWRESLQALAVLVAAQRGGRAASARRVARDAALSSEMAEAALEALAGSGYVARVAGDRWTLTGDPDRITLAEIRSRLFAGRGRALPVVPAGIAEIVAAADRASEAALDLKLSALVPVASGDRTGPAGTAPAMAEPAPPRAPNVTPIAPPRG